MHFRIHYLYRPLSFIAEIDYEPIDTTIALNSSVTTRWLTTAIPETAMVNAEFTARLYLLGMQEVKQKTKAKKVIAPRDVELNAADLINIKLTSES